MATGEGDDADATVDGAGAAETAIRPADAETLTRPPPTEVASVEGSPDARAPLPGRFLVRGRLGAGAMGEVHLCYDERVGRSVAIKTARAALARDPALRARFLTEARVQGALEHPAIVPVHDLEASDDGGAFFVMKRVNGESLRAVLDRVRAGDPAYVQRYGPRRLLSAFATVCLAVAFAHARGVVHRDIKPSNIMLGEFGEVYLLDWGVAHVAAGGGRLAESGPSVRGDGGLTQHGDVVGTLGYMSPEQLRGEAIDGRADVYALGATLFEVLTLQPLHDRNPQVATRSTLEGVDARASVRAPHREIPPELEELCVRTTASDPAERLPTAQAVHDRVAAYLDGERDREMRRARAAELAEGARAAFAEASLGGPGAPKARERALSLVNRALALDGANALASRVLGGLVARPGEEASRETDAALLASGGVLIRVIVRTSAVLFGAWLLFLGAIAALGVRLWWPFLGATAALGATALMLPLHARRPRAVTGWGLVASTNLAALCCSLTFGPFLVLPAVLSAIAVAFAIVSRPEAWVRRNAPGLRGIRVGSYLAPVLTFAVALGAELSGALPPSFALRDGTIVLLPRAVDFPAGATLPLLALMHAMLIAAPSVAVLRVRDQFFAAEQRALALAAHLRALSSREVRQAAGELASLPGERGTEAEGDAV